MALRVLMFTDLVGSTSLKTRLGDNAAGALIDEHRDLIRSLCTQMGGQIIDNAGDGFFLKFYEPSPALRFSLSLPGVAHSGAASRRTLHHLFQPRRTSEPGFPATSGHSRCNLQARRRSGRTHLWAAAEQECAGQ